MNDLVLPTQSGIKSAIDTIRPYLPETPLVKSELLSQLLEADIWLKNETVTPIASFKFRGALNSAVNAHNQGIQGLVTSSTGNHGQGVAYAARMLGMSADIFLPKPANPLKAKMINAFGGTVHEIGEDFDIAKEASQEFAEKNQLTFIDDGNDPIVMEGAGTIGHEICTQLAKIDLALIPMGGGNLSAGCSVAIKAMQTECDVVTIQAKGSPAVTESFHAREILERPINTVADGLITRVPPKLAMDVLWQNVSDAWLASDEDLMAATRSMIESAHILVEPAGAAALAGACANRDRIKGKRVVFVVTGANISAELLSEALSREPLV